MDEPDLAGEGIRVWRTETKVVMSAVADDLLSPMFPIRLENDLCGECENAADRIVYISRKLNDPRLRTADAVANSRQFYLNALLVTHFVNKADLALSRNKPVRVWVRTDLRGKRTVSGKFRDPVVRIAICARDGCR